jgi:putative hemolysin
LHALHIPVANADDNHCEMPQERQSFQLQFAFRSASMVEFSPSTLAFAYPLPLAPAKPAIHAEVGRYRLRLAESAEDREAACRLRFKVFNIELHEGLESSYQTGLDTDQFDLVCDHLLVEDKLDRRIVGTYRMQSGSTAAANLGYYSEQEFNLAAYEPLRAGILELGRASIDREHRTPEVLTLLWRGIAQYAANMGLRYLLGCSSINSQDPAEGWQMYRQLEHYRVSPELETEPTAAYVCPTQPRVTTCEELPGTESSSQLGDEVLQAGMQVKVPKLLKTYLAIGCCIGGPPAWDRDFGTIDFLTFLDLKQVTTSVRNRFLAPLSQ